jgi:hypothetical protein
MGGESRTHGLDEKCIQSFGTKSWAEDFRYLNVNGRIILKWTLGK